MAHRVGPLDSLGFGRSKSRGVHLCVSAPGHVLPYNQLINRVQVRLLGDSARVHQPQNLAGIARSTHELNWRLLQMHARGCLQA